MMPWRANARTEGLSGFKGRSRFLRRRLRDFNICGWKYFQAQAPHLILHASPNPWPKTTTTTTSSFLKHTCEQSANHHLLITRVASAAGLLHEIKITKEFYRGKKWGGRKSGSKTKKRGEYLWPRDYLVENPIYPLKNFRRRFHVERTLFYNFARAWPHLKEI